MLTLPTLNHPARQNFEVADLARVASPENRDKLVGFRAALDKGRAFISSQPGIKAVYVFALRADGQLWLVKVTPKAWKKTWNFGPLMMGA